MTVSGADVSVGEFLVGNLGDWGGTSEIAGVVLEDTDGSGDISASDVGAAGIEVALYSGKAIVASVLTDEKGAFSFPRRAAGDYTVAVLVQAKQVVLVEAGGTVPPDGQADVTVAVGERFGVGDFLVSEGAEGETNVDGNVWHDVDENLTVGSPPDQAIAGMLLQVVNKDTGAILGSDVTDAAGFYAFSDIPAGTWVLRAVEYAPWAPAADPDGSRPADAQASITVVNGQVTHVSPFLFWGDGGGGGTGNIRVHLGPSPVPGYCGTGRTTVHVTSDAGFSQSIEVTDEMYQGPNLPVFGTVDLDFEVPAGGGISYYVSLTQDWPYGNMWDPPGADEFAVPEGGVIDLDFNYTDGC